MSSGAADGAALEMSLAALQLAVERVAQGDFSCRAEVEFAEDHPIGALALGVNSMIDSLRTASEEADRHLAALEEQISTVEAQREAIRELSTPIIEVWRGVLCLPVVGIFDSTRATDLANEILHAVVDREARFVIMDITGIETMDTSTTGHFVRLARAVSLLGADCALSGVNPGVARTVVELGTDLGELRSHRSLRDALKSYVNREITRRLAEAARSLDAR
jgi:rsbT co-antagonist protein RsbR